LKLDNLTGRKPVKAIYKREEVFKGKHADLAAAADRSGADDPRRVERAVVGRAHRTRAARAHRFGRGVSKKEPAAATAGMSSGEDASSVSDTEADEMEEHLRGLGYLE
jgi:hypothetical protein